MTSVEKILSTARSEIGYLEKASNYNLDNKTANAGHANYTKYARDLDATNIYNGKKNGYNWCDIFVDWCFVTTFGFEMALQMTYQPTNSYGAGCTSSASYYKNNNKFFTSNPQPGDQIFFTNDGGKSFYHTGIVEKVENGRVYTIEGNTSSLAGVVSNGGAVRDKSYLLTYKYIGGYGRPNYSLYKDKTSNNNVTTESVTSPVTTQKIGTVISKSGIKCRESANILSKQVGAFNYGAKLNILKTINDWYCVSGTAGWGKLSNVWVSSKYVKVTNNIITTTTTKTTTANLNFRTGRGTAYSRIAVIPKGTIVSVSDLSNGWYKVVYNGKTGYVCADYLK